MKFPRSGKRYLSGIRYELRFPRKWKKGIYLVKGKNRDFPGGGNEFPRSGKKVFTWQKGKPKNKKT